MPESDHARDYDKRDDDYADGKALPAFLDVAFDSLELDAATVRQRIEDALHDGYVHFREHGKVTRWYMIERDWRRHT